MFIVIVPYEMAMIRAIPHFHTHPLRALLLIGLAIRVVMNCSRPVTHISSPDFFSHILNFGLGVNHSEPAIMQTYWGYTINIYQLSTSINLFMSYDFDLSYSVGKSVMC